MHGHLRAVSVSYQTIADLRSQLGQPAGSQTRSPEYVAKMLHPLPPAVSVKRDVFLAKHATGKRVLDIGASGPLGQALRLVASAYAGIDREDDGAAVIGFDLDDVQQTALPTPPFTPELIVCGEVLEHLSNPGWFLTRLHRQFPGVPTLISVPNAFAAIQQRWIAKGTENVNRDHVAWYSPQTVRVLLERAGYTAQRVFWYGGDGPTAEGLIVACE